MQYSGRERSTKPAYDTTPDRKTWTAKLRSLDELARGLAQKSIVFAQVHARQAVLLLVLTLLSAHVASGDPAFACKHDLFPVTVVGNPRKLTDEQLDLVCKVIWPGMSYKKVLTRLKVLSKGRTHFVLGRNYMGKSALLLVGRHECLLSDKTLDAQAAYLDVLRLAQQTQPGEPATSSAVFLYDEENDKMVGLETIRGEGAGEDQWHRVVGLSEYLVCLVVILAALTVGILSLHILTTTREEKIDGLRVSAGGVLSVGTAADAREIPQLLHELKVLAGPEFSAEEVAMAETAAAVPKYCPDAGPVQVASILQAAYQEATRSEECPAGIRFSDEAAGHRAVLILTQLQKARQHLTPAFVQKLTVPKEEDAPSEDEEA